MDPEELDIEEGKSEISLEGKSEIIDTAIYLGKDSDSSKE